MTTTDSIASQSVGTSTNIGEGKFPQKITAQSTTSGFFVSLRLTNGAGSYPRPTNLRCWFTSSNFSITAAAAVLALRQQARYVDLRPSPDASGVMCAQSELEVLAGAYIYFWFDVPTLSVAATLDASCVEI